MPLPLLELPVVATAFLLLPSQNPPERPISRASQRSRTIADCCVHFRDRKADGERVSNERMQLSAVDDGGRANHAEL